jgi:hypothetical protein
VIDHPAADIGVHERVGIADGQGPKRQPEQQKNARRPPKLGHRSV